MKIKFKEWLLKEEESASMTAEIPMPPDIQLLNKLFKNHGKKLYAVGGAVRDYLYNIHHEPHKPYTPDDIDLTTDANPDEILEILNSDEAKEAKIEILPKGKDFGIISAILNGEEYEIATFREDIYDPLTGDGRRPDQVKFVSAAEDAKRRDFTMNAIFYDIDKKEIIDFNTVDGKGQGIEDIKNPKVRVVGNANQRFKEDKLRVLRYIRFLSKYEPHKTSGDIEEDIVKSIQDYKTLEGVSIDRIMEEFMKGFKVAKNKVNFFNNLKDFGLLPSIFPTLQANIEGLKNTNSLPATLLYIFRDYDPRMLKTKLHELKYPNSVTDKVELLANLRNLQSSNIIQMIKRKNAIKAENDVAQYAILFNDPIYAKFATYQQQTKSQDFMNLKGPQISQAMNQKEMQLFQAH